MEGWERHFEQLIREEQLDDIEKLLTPREWDEVPWVSRLRRIDFLAGLDAREKSRVLLVSAVKHLERIVDFARANHRTDVVVMVSLLDWEDFRAQEPEPVIPNFWICTNVERDLARFRLRPGVSDEAQYAMAWLRSADLLQTHEVFDNSEPVKDPHLRRVYIARRDSPGVERLIER
jgi:hypothetical protein